MNGAKSQFLDTRIVNVCHVKCIPPRYSDSDLNKGESVCIDRCVSKYIETHTKVGAKLAELSAPQQAAFLAAQQQQ